MAQQVKRCTKCGDSGPPTSFTVDRSKKDGLYSSCKSCVKQTNGVAQLAAARRWKKRNPAHIAAYKKSRYVGNPRPPKDPLAPRRAKVAWKKRNPALVVADKATRRAREFGATPAWANLFFIAEAHDLARRREAATDMKWHVDHIVPLRSKTVCGLHVERNLRVIPASVNMAKSNSHWPDMP